MLARGGLEVDLGCRTREQAESLLELRRNERYLDGIELPENVSVLRAGELELSRHDLVVFAVPASQLPAAVAAHGGAITPRTGVLVCAKGLVPPLGTLPAAFVSERVRSWASFSSSCNCGTSGPRRSAKSLAISSPYSSLS